MTVLHVYINQKIIILQSSNHEQRKEFFVGYSLDPSGYRIWFSQENSIIESKHMAFDESQMGKPMASNKLSQPLFLNDLNDSLIVHLQIPDNKSFLSPKGQDKPKPRIPDEERDEVFKDPVSDIIEKKVSRKLMVAVNQTYSQLNMRMKISKMTLV